MSTLGCIHPSKIESPKRNPQKRLYYIQRVWGKARPPPCHAHSSQGEGSSSTRLCRKLRTLKLRVYVETRSNGLVIYHWIGRLKICLIFGSMSGRFFGRPFFQFLLSCFRSFRRLHGRHGTVALALDSFSSPAPFPSSYKARRLSSFDYHHTNRVTGISENSSWRRQRIARSERVVLTKR